ncbi:hypothetical protein L3X39_07925 [Sabulilitoribacter multivorans]|uniref:Lipoprotein n=1 Tax=Flaviramulus multivorans TaxID=1304750 RepID=A0ABS9IIH9_9FLAO|nr:hypothetical protein [Flaviramulus multivorans]MCF7560562.1 hypothetical protein [Flaviramulus multivorans]
MKAIKLYFLLAIIILLAACSPDNSVANNNNLENAISKQGCQNVSGPTAIYWDYANGIPAPLSQIPVLANPGPQFIHSQHPYLGLILPQGYTAFEDQDLQTASLGVNIIRNDNAVIWRYVPLSTFAENTSVTSIISREINTMLNFYGIQNIDDVLCSVTKPLDSPLNMTYSGRLLRFGNFTALVYVIVTQVQGLPASAVLSISAGPSTEYNNLVMDIFLPLSFQLLVSDRDSLSDRDGDGTPDIFDSEPDNPNVQ